MGYISCSPVEVGSNQGTQSPLRTLQAHQQSNYRSSSVQNIIEKELID